MSQRSLSRVTIVSCLPSGVLLTVGPASQVRPAPPHAESTVVAAEPSNVAGSNPGSGACCFGPFGSCVPTDEAQCTQAGGRFKGLGSTCDQNACHGACCFG